MIRAESRCTSCSGLRDALIASLNGLPDGGSAWVPVDPSGKTEHAWAWLTSLIRRRSDWRVCAGIALQHAVLDGTRRAREAFADLVTNDTSLVLIEDLLAPLAQHCGDDRVSRPRTGWGVPGGTLAEAMTDRARALAATAAEDWSVRLPSPGTMLGFRLEAVPDPAALVDLMVRTAATSDGVRDEWGGRGPWSWLYAGLVFRPWVAEAAPEAIAEAVERGGATAAGAALDWLSAGWDLAHYVEALHAWQVASPPWWNRSVGEALPGWRRPIATSSSSIGTFGEAVVDLSRQAAEQRATPPDLDLDPRC